MKNKILILTLTFLVLFTISSVCAGDVNDSLISNQDISQNELTTIEDNIELNIDESHSLGENNVINEEDNGTFTALQQKIDNAGDNSTIIFANNYTYDNGFTANGILINKSLTIDGKGYTINANHQSRIFNITASNVTLKNINFINSNASYGGAIFWDSGTEGKIIESTFKNNNVIGRGGAIEIVNASKCEINDCTFENNSANRSAGAIYVHNSTSISIDKSKFENNHVNYSGGAIYFDGDNGSISNSNFTNNKARYNGAACMNGENGNVNNCIFTNNTATESAGALGWERKGNGNIEKNTFKNNNAPTGGAIYQNSATNVTIANSIFESNTASENGGAIFWDNGTKGKIIESTFKNNKADGFGGAIFSNDTDNEIISNCLFENNKAQDGGALYFEDTNGIIKESNFTNNAANKESGYSGAIFFEGNNLDITLSEFVNNSAYNEGAIFAIGETVTISKSQFESNKAENSIVAISADNTLIDKCEFISNSAESYVGISNIYGTMTVNNSYFTNNTAEKSTRLIRNSQYSTTIITNCVFENNVGNENNYSIDNNYGTIYLHNNTLNTKSGEIHNYGGNISSPCTAIIMSNGSFVYGVKTKLIAFIKDDNENLIEEGYYVYFNVNGSLVEAEYNSEISGYEVEYVFNTLGLVEIFTVCPSINITDNQGINGTVTKSTKLTASSVITTYNVVKKLVVTLKDSDEVLANKKVTVKVGKISKTLKTNSKGQISVDVSILTPKAYTASIKFAGDKYYSSSSKSVKVTVKKANPKLTAKVKSFKKSVKTKKYSITLKTNKNKAMKKTKVTLKVKGKTYTAKTNSKGKATFKITKLTKKGTFKAIIKYNGNSYYNKVTKKVNIKIK